MTFPELIMIPTITPKRPRADPKISTIKILMNKLSSCAWDKAHAEPVTPTHTLLHTKPPAVTYTNKDQKSAVDEEQPDDGRGSK